ncbi:MAG: hypothetical protein CVV27_10945, partial [Candidatus Melainabacteria bacterium HGW-Melainabacteria-1]
MLNRHRSTGLSLMICLTFNLNGLPAQAQNTVSPDVQASRLAEQQSDTWPEANQLQQALASEDLPALEKLLADPEWLNGIYDFDISPQIEGLGLSGSMYSPLMWAMIHGRLNLAKWLATRPGALLNGRDQRGLPALAYAALSGNQDILAWYFEVASPMPTGGQSIRGSEAAQLMGWLAIAGQPELFDWLNKEHGIGPASHPADEALLNAARHGHLGLYQKLISTAGIQARDDSQQKQALLAAASGGHLEMLQWLWHKGRQNMSADRDLTTAMISRALDSGSADLLKWLQTQGWMQKAWLGQEPYALHMAARSGNHDLVAYLLEQGAEISARDSDDWDALQHALAYGQEQIVKQLLSLGADPKGNFGGSSRLQAAAQGGLNERVRQWLDNPDSPPEDARVQDALFQAAANGHLDTVALLHSRASLEKRNSDSETLLHVAAYMGHQELVEWLLDRSPGQLHAQNKHGETPLWKAVQAGHLQLMKRLIDKGASPNHPDPNGDYLSHALAWDSSLHALDWLRQQKLLDLHVRNHLGQTPLLKAASHGEFQTVRWLISQGASLNARTRQGKSIWHEALRSHQPELLDWLARQSGIDTLEPVDIPTWVNLPPEQVNDWLKYWPEERDKALGALLIAQINIGNLPYVQDLIEEWGADPQRLVQGKTAYEHSFLKDNPRLNAYLASHHPPNWRDGAGNTRLHLIARAGWSTQTHAWLKQRPEHLQVRNRDGRTPLMAAIEPQFFWVSQQSNQHTRLGLIKDMQRQGSPIAEADLAGLWPIHFAAAEGQLDILKYLLKDLQMPVTTLDAEGHGLLWHALSSGSIPMLEWLNAKYGEELIETEDPAGLIPQALTHGQLSAAFWLHEHLSQPWPEPAQIWSLLESVWSIDRPKLLLKLPTSNSASELVVLIKHSHFAAARHWLQSQSEPHELELQPALDQLMLSGEPQLLREILNFAMRHRLSLDTRDLIQNLISYDQPIAMLDTVLSMRLLNPGIHSAPGANALISAVNQGNKHAWQRLLAAGAPITGLDEDGNGLVHLAASTGQLPLLKQLIQTYKLPLNPTNHQRMTPLMVAASNAQLEAVAWLLAQGAQTSVRDHQDRGLPEHAAASRSLTQLQFLAQHKEIHFDVDTVLRSALSAESPNPSMVSWLLANGANPNLRDPEGLSP